MSDGAMPFNDFFRGRRVLVTGETGFKGSWLAFWLKHLGAEVHGLSLEPETDPSNFVVLELERELSHNRIDLRDVDAVKRTVGGIRPELIFHLAAQAIVRVSYEQPVETLASNYMGTAHLLQAVREAGYSAGTPCTVVCITSDKCYENRETDHAYQEQDRMGGYDIYSMSKGSAELLINSWRRSFFNPSEWRTHGISLSSVRAGNVIGGGDWAKDRIVPDCVRALAMGKKIRIRNPFAVRPWQHVLEPLSGYLWLASNLILQGEEYAGAWNFGPKNGHGMAVEGLVRSFVEIWGAGRGYECSKPEKDFHEADYLQLDCSKACRKLVWMPVLDVDEAVRWTVDWYKRHYIENENAYDLCMENILAYSELAGERSLKWASCQPVQV